MLLVLLGSTVWAKKIYSWDAHVLPLGGVLSVPFGFTIREFGGPALLLITGIRGSWGQGWSRGVVTPEHFCPDVGTEEFKIFSI